MARCHQKEVKIVEIFLTHGHSDHTGSTAAMVARPDSSAEGCERHSRHRGGELFFRRICHSSKIVVIQVWSQLLLLASLLK
jgi:glyoxylase-like metal-dependent hydrolase (beta-lactamase superfamily II)